MLTFGKLAKKQTLDLVFPGPDCADPRCLDLCAEACDAALSLRLDPKEVLRKTIQRELHSTVSRRMTETAAPAVSDSFRPQIL